MPTHSGGEGREKRKSEGMCGGTHTTFLVCFGEERNKVLTLSCEGIPDVEGYDHGGQGTGDQTRDLAGFNTFS